MGSEKVEVVERATVFQGHFRVDRYRLRHRLFAGGWSGVMTREVFERGHAAAVLPYDPRRDEVVLIEQFRVGAVAAGMDPWMLEVVAGIVEPGETEEEVSRREAVEEANLTVSRLEPIVRFMPTPGACSETIALFCGEVDASGAGGIHGLAAEHEDIRVHVLPASEVPALLDGGRLANATAIVALSWFARRHGELRRRWLAG